MIDVHETIAGIVMFSDESLLNVRFGNGYSFKKKRFDDLAFKDKIVDGKGKLANAYFMSRLIEDDVIYFICIEKDGIFQINGPVLADETQCLTGKDLMCEEELNHHRQEEIAYLNKMIHLLHVFKAGNIGFNDIYITYQYNTLGLFNNMANNNIFYANRNFLDLRKFTLSQEETALCNQFLIDYSGVYYLLLFDCIKEFVGALEQLDMATRFEQFTTVLEMTLLEHNQKAKKQVLAKRVSAMIGQSNADVQNIHKKLLDFYRYRSESLHEGDDSNITTTGVQELEEIVRIVLKGCLARCQRDYSANQGITWEEIKKAMINDLKTKASTLEAQGVFI